MCLSSVSHHQSQTAFFLRWRLHPFLLLLSLSSSSTHSLPLRVFNSLTFIRQAHQIQIFSYPTSPFLTQIHYFHLYIQSFEDHQQWLQSTPTSPLPLSLIPATLVWLLSAAAMLSGIICAQIGSMFTPHLIDIPDDTNSPSPSFQLV